LVLAFNRRQYRLRAILPRIGRLGWHGRQRDRIGHGLVDVEPAAEIRISDSLAGGPLGAVQPNVLVVGLGIQQASGGYALVGKAWNRDDWRSSNLAVIEIENDSDQKQWGKRSKAIV
jgi:hypothetical protein